jgi:hypothetical protein
MDWLLTREAVISLAVLGAVFSTAASALQVRGKIGPARASQLNSAGYACMGVSMLLFIIVGYRA